MVAAKNIMPRPTQEGSVLTNVNGRWGEGQVRAYKVYTALLTQTGTDAPVATVLENTLGGTVVWTYSNVGEYTATLSSAFTTNKVFFIERGKRDFVGEGPPWVFLQHTSTNTIKLFIHDGSDPQELNNLAGGYEPYPIEIRVYD